MHEIEIEMFEKCKKLSSFKKIIIKFTENWSLVVTLKKYWNLLLSFKDNWNFVKIIENVQNLLKIKYNNWIFFIIEFLKSIKKIW